MKDKRWSITSGEDFEKAYRQDNYYIVEENPPFEGKGSCEKECCRKVFRKPRAVIYFSSSGIYFPNTAQAFRKAILEKNRFEFLHSDLKIDAEKSIYVRDVAKQFYITGISEKIPDIDSLIDFLKKETEGYEVCTVGSSAGAYMAVLAACELDAVLSYAFSGYFDLTIVEKEVWPYIDKYGNDPSKSKYYRLKQYIENSTAKIVYFYPGRLEGDVRQSNCIKEVENVISIPADSELHGLCIPRRITKYLFNLDWEEAAEKLSLFQKNHSGMVKEMELYRFFLGGDWEKCYREDASEGENHMKSWRIKIGAMWADRRERKKLAVVGIWLIVSLFLFYCFIYNDLVETMRVSISFWDELFAGRVRYFYAGSWKLTAAAYTSEVYVTYDFPIYIIFSLWNFPLWILEHFFGINVLGSALCLMWGKTLILVVCLFIMKAIYRLCITLDLEEGKAWLACMLFFTSNFFMTSVIMMSAYDIIALYFMIEGIRYYFEGSSRRFLACFMLAVPLKFFALLVFIPLLLLKEKRIPHIIGYAFMSILPIIVFRFLLPSHAVYGQPETVALGLSNIFGSTDNGGIAFLYVTGYEQPAVLSRIFPSVTAWILLFLLCYFLKPDTEEKWKKWGIYVCFLTDAILFGLCMSHPYWLLIMVPFVVILMMQNYKYLYVNLVLETVFTWGMILAQILRFPWCFGNAIAAGMIVPKLFGGQDSFMPVTPLTVLEKITEDISVQGAIVGFGGSIFIAGLLLFAVLNLPVWKQEFPVIGKYEKPAWWLVGIRVAAGFALACIPIVLHIIGLRIG